MYPKFAVFVALFFALFFTSCNSPFSNDGDGDKEPDVIIADLFEPDNSQSMAKPIIPDSASQSHTLKKEDVDWVSFYGTAGNSYKIFTTGSTDTRIKVYSSSYSLLTEGDDSPGNVNATVTINCSSSSTYYVCVSGGDATISGKYELQVTSSVGLDVYEPDSIPKFAKTISSTSTIQYHTLSENDVDWVSLYAYSADSIIVSANGTCKINISLYDRDTTTILQSSIKSDSVARIKFRVSSTGYYFARIYAQNSSSTGTYKLTYLTSSNGLIEVDDDYENDDTKGTAKLISVSTPIQNRTLPTGDTDWVKMPVQVGKQYSITSSNSYVYGIMYTKTGIILSGPSSTLTLNSSDNDTVFIKFYSTSSSSISYILTLTTLLQPTMIDEYETDNTKELAKAKCLATDSFIQARTLSYVNNVPDTDWVAFPAINGKRYTFKISVSSTGSSYAYYYIYTKTSSSYQNYSSTSSTGSLSYTATESDTLFFMVRLSGSSPVAYSLSVQGTLNNDSYEPDSTRSLAKILSSSVQSRILIPKDTDWISYTATAGDSIVIFTTGQTDTKLSLFTSSGSTPILTNDNQSSSDKNGLISWKAALGGSYYICVSGSTPLSTGPYELRLASISLGTIVAPDSFEVDNKKSSAQLIKDTILTNQTHSLTLGDTDWVAFPVVAGARYTYKTTNSSSSTYLYMYLYSSKDSLISSYTSTYSPSLTYTAAKSDTVFLRISAPSSVAISQYFLSMTRVPPPQPDAYEDDNTKAKAQIIKDSIVSSQPHSLTENDIDWIALPVTAGGTYTISASNSTGFYIDMYVYTSKDSLIISRTSYSSPSYSYTAPKTDTIYYRFTASSTPVSAYYVSMSRTLPPGPDAFEVDNSKMSARFLSSSVSSEIHSLPVNDTDCIKFKAVKGGQYTITTSNSTSYYMNFYLYNSKDSLLYSRLSYTSPSVTYTPVNNDTLYCKITSTGSSISRYTLSFSFTTPPEDDKYEIDNTRALAKLISLDSIQSRTLTYSDSDWVKIRIDSGYTYTVSSPATFYHYLYLYNSVSSTYIATNAGSSPSCSITSTATDTLSILVRYYSASLSYTGPYTLSVTRK
jgi:hypothetical protein